MRSHVSGFRRPAGVVGGLPAACLPSRHVYVDTQVAQQQDGVCAGLSVELIAQTGGE